MQWYNEPSQWHAQDNTVTVQVGPGTDFWRLTHSGIIRDNGHFYYQSHEGDFLAQVKFSGQYASLYDQAGLMVRVDEDHWLKCGVEFLDGVQHASAVVTREYSDWSFVALPDNPASLWLRVKRQGITLEVYYSLDGEHYQLLRQAYLSHAPIMQIGLLCASPEGPGFPVTFENFTLR
jgi:regulation of enolase protein 1 (concanavalin A-like superfamily)